MADADLQNAFNLINSFAIDNKSILLDFFVAIGVVVLVIVIVRIVLSYTTKR